MKQLSPTELYQLLQDVTSHIITWAKPGMRMCDVDREARRMMGECSKYFTHSLGHGVGLEIHESPRVSGKSREILCPGMVITIEPGVYGLTIKKAESREQNEGRNIVTPVKAGVYPDNTVIDSTSRPSINSGLGWNDGKTYGLRYEEMVLIDKEKLRVI